MENSTSIDMNALSKDAIKHGCILGVIGIVLSLLIYIFDVAWFASLWLILILLIVNMGYTVYAGINFRRQVGGYLSFQKAFFHGAILIMTAMIIGRLFAILLFNVIDPNLGQTVTDITVDQWSERMTRWGAPESQIDETITKMRTDMTKGFTTSGILISIFWPGLVIAAIAASITGLIVKKKEREII